jgi:hypothetical protein
MDQLIEDTLYKKIEDVVYELDCSWIEACVIYAARHEIDIEDLGQAILMNSNIQVHIREEAEDNRLLPREARLPI